VLVAGPVLVGRLVRARSQLAHRLGEATQRLASARSERIATALTADRAWLSESIDAALLDGLARMARYSECATLEQVSALEGIGRELLGRMRALLKDLRDGGQALEPNGSLTELHARVQRAIEAEAALRTAQGASLAPPRRWTLFSDRVVDRALALVATAVSVGLVLNALGSGAPHVPRWVAALLAVLVTAPIAFARRSALQATVASVLAAFAYVALVRPGDPNSGWLPTGALIVFPLALAVTCSPGRAAAGLGLCVAQFVGLAVVDPAAKLDATTVAPGLAIAVGTWIAGQVLRDRTRLLGALADAAVGIEDERERIGRAALATQRAKVARELHDAVAHAMTVIVLQAGAARRVWESDPELAREHAATLKDTVSEVITELRGMMVALGAGNGHASADLERLVRRAERSGMRVQLEIAGDRSRAEGDVGHTAYRVLQEALTNAARHAPGADVLVRLEFEPSALTVEVANRLPALAPRPTEGAGHGLRGMRERVEGCGGRLFAGARPAGGFAVRAWLPCP
jgi:signal transduction histidine kinase